MKKIFILILLVVSCSFCRAQSAKTDSLLVQIEKTGDPQKINDIASEVIKIPQGNIALLNQGRRDLAKANTAGTLIDKERALIEIGIATWDLRYAPEMLDACLQGIRVSRELKDSASVMHFMHLAGLANYFQQDPGKSDYYFLTESKLATMLHDTNAMMNAYSNLESCYAASKMTDSALLIARLEMRLARSYSKHNYYNFETTYGDYGEVLMGANHPDSALKYYRLAYIYYKLRKTEDPIVSYMENNMATAYLQTGRRDSAAKYALFAYQEALRTNYWEFKANATGTLAKIYDGGDNKKSLYYLKLQSVAKDSINAAEKQRQFEMITQREHQHDEDLKTAQERFNFRIQLFSVIGAAVVLMVIGLILWRNNRRQKHTNVLLSEQKEEISAQRDNLESKNHELAIESSLERVRSVAMGMQQPDDMLNICREIAVQLELLGISNIRNVQTAIVYEDKGTYVNYEYYRLHDKTFITEVDYTGHRIQVDFINEMRIEGGYKSLTLEGEELREWYEHQKISNQFPDSHVPVAGVLDYNWFSLGQVALGISLYEKISEQNLALFKRFLDVFKLAYRRYIDITNANAQAREAQIEAALEKVRSRSLAMHKSDELAETAYILFQQFKELGENPDQATIGIINEKEWVIEYWVTMHGSQTNKVFRFSIDEPNVTRRIYDGWKAQEKSLVIDLTGQQLFDFSNYRKSMGGAAFNPEEQRRVVNVAFFSKGLINVQSKESRSAESIKLLERFAAVFEQTYTRFLDLQKAEAQAREGKIELALERVRAKTMAMQHSNELLATSQLLFEQLTELGETADQMSIGIVNEQEGFFELFATLHGNPMLQVFKPPLDEPYMMGKVYKAWKAQEKSFLIEIAGGELRNYNIHRNSIAKTKYYSEDIGPDDRWVLSGSSFSKGLLGFSTSKTPGKEDRALLERFANVFEQTYTRFLDLQKAEAQAREAQIEAGLERVRSRTMAMQKSDELAETVSLLFKQLLSLGIKTEQIRTCGIVTFDANKPVGEQWITETNGDIIPQSFMVPYNEAPAYKAIYNGWKKGEKFMVIHLEGQALKEHLGYLAKGTNVPTRDVVLPAQATEIYNHVMFFSQGCLFIITKEPLPEYHEVFKRFGAVFQQSYTRFLDLQKAEAQARDAQIEAALERVRSRSMGMLKSEELKEVIQVVYDQFIHLNINIEHTGFVVDYTAGGDWHFWVADKVGSPAQLTVTDYDSKWTADFNEAKEKSIDFFTTSLNFEEKNKFYHDLFAHAGEMPEEEKKLIFSKPGLAASTVLQADVALYIENFEGIPYTIEENAILMRFGKVFQQTYTRFLDLKQAEEQAREAQIEASLERLRSKTMAMHNSRDVAEAVITMFDELVKLGIDPAVRSGIGIIHNKELFEVWTGFTKTGGTVTLDIGSLDMNTHPLLEHVYTGWKNKETSVSYAMTGDEVKDYFKVINDAPDFHFTYPMDKVPKSWYNDAFFFPEGAIFVFNIEPLPTEIARLYKRFAGVFGLTYRRYLDLQKAEAQARDAQIEASLERVRGKAMAMRNSNDLLTAASTVFTELQHLGINQIRSGVGLITKDFHKAKVYSATSLQSAIDLSLMGEITLYGHPVFEQQYQSWLKRENYFVALEGKELASYYKILSAGLNANLGGTVKKSQKEYGHWFMFSEGFLYAWSDSEYTDAEIKILERFKNVLELTIRRYIELQKSETQAREAVRQASLDRVRAEIASMRTTSDLERIIPLIWNELTILGVPFIRCGVFIIDEQQQQIHSYLSTPDGKAIAAFQIPFTAEGVGQAILVNWRQRQAVNIHWTEEEFKNFSHNLVEEGEIESEQNYLTAHPPTSLDLHFFPFLQGMLYAGNMVPLSADERGIVQSLADAFSTAYARYEDFNKLEAAKQQVENTLTDLKGAQIKLIQSEKMASLGELTAGIAHEIQNPLNFVNNFSEVSIELLEELQEEAKAGNIADVVEIALSLTQNLEKINHHGKRADSIVKGMLEHSRVGKGEKQLTNFNTLADEFMKLSYHGLRAKDKSFNAELVTNFNNDLPKLNIVQQDIGRVLLNLFNNAFYAVSQKQKTAVSDYKPEVTVSTSIDKNNLVIKVKDNGNGIPENIKDKIMQPFFTTKPTGEGTGLGLSLSYDIVVKGHGGSIQVNSVEGKGSEFIIQLPIN